MGLIALAKAKPGTIAYGTPGTASTNHVAGALLETMASIKLLHIPFKGAGPALTAPAVKERFNAIGFDIRTSTPEAFSQFIKEDMARIAKVIQSAGIKAE